MSVCWSFFFFIIYVCYLSLPRFPVAFLSFSFRISHFSCFRSFVFNKFLRIILWLVIFFFKKNQNKHNYIQMWSGLEIHIAIVYASNTKKEQLYIGYFWLSSFFPSHFVPNIVLLLLFSPVKLIFDCIQSKFSVKYIWLSEKMEKQKLCKNEYPFCKNYSYSGLFDWININIYRLCVTFKCSQCPYLQYNFFNTFVCLILCVQFAYLHRAGVCVWKKDKKNSFICRITLYTTDV